MWISHSQCDLHSAEYSRKYYEDSDDWDEGVANVLSILRPQGKIRRPSQGDESQIIQSSESNRAISVAWGDSLVGYVLELKDELDKIFEVKWRCFDHRD